MKRLLVLMILPLLCVGCAGRCKDSYRTFMGGGNGIYGATTSGGACCGECFLPDKKGRLKKCGCTLRCPCWGEHNKAR